VNNLVARTSDLINYDWQKSFAEPMKLIRLVLKRKTMFCKHLDLRLVS